MARRVFKTQEERDLAKKERQKSYEAKRKGGVRFPTSRLNNKESTSLEKLYAELGNGHSKRDSIMLCINYTLSNIDELKSQLQRK